MGTNFSEILFKIIMFSFKKMPLKVSSAKQRPFCLGLNVSNHRWPQGQPWSGSVSLKDFICNQYYSQCTEIVKAKFYICHDSTGIMTCAKFCCDHAQTWILRSRAISFRKVLSWDITNCVSETLTYMLTMISLRDPWMMIQQISSTGPKTHTLWHGVRLWCTCLFKIHDRVILPRRQTSAMGDLACLLWECLFMLWLPYWSTQSNWCKFVKRQH